MTKPLNGEKLKDIDREGIGAMCIHAIVIKGHNVYTMYQGLSPD